MPNISTQLAHQEGKSHLFFSTAHGTIRGTGEALSDVAPVPASMQLLFQDLSQVGSHQFGHGASYSVTCGIII